MIVVLLIFGLTKTLLGKSSVNQIALPPVDKRGPICYACSKMRYQSLCNQVELCSRDQYCEVLKTPHPFYDVTYTTQCGAKLACERLIGMGHGFGRSIDTQKRSSLCLRCCKGDLCNLGCDEPTTTSSIPTSQTSITSSTTTTSPSTTSTKPSVTTVVTSSTTTKSPLTTSTKPSVTTTVSVSQSITNASVSTIGMSSPYSTTAMVNAAASSTVATNSSNHGCLPEYIYYGKSCYYFSKTSLYWGPSRKFCKDHGSDLVVINDATENNLIVQHLKQLVAQHLLPSDLWGFYIGAQLVNGKWMWVDNTEVKFTDWAKGEPDNLVKQTYASIYVPSSRYYNYQWASHSDMYTTSYFICEYNPIP